MKSKLPLPAFLFATSSFANAALVLSESFNYATPGPIITATGSPWTQHSGTTAGQVDVGGGAVNLTGGQTEDVNAPLSGGPYTTGLLTATFTVNFSVVPTLVGTYFAHFRDSNPISPGFRSRVWANTTGAAPGFFRLGITSAGTPTTSENVLTDLAIDTPYRVTMTWDLDTNSSTLSVDGGTAVTALDTASSISVTSFALRQSTGMGDLTMDDLSVDYIPEPGSAMLLGTMGILGILRRRR